MNPHARVMALLATLLLAEAAAAMPTLKTIKLRQQRGEDVAAALEPLLEPGERVVGLPDAVAVSAEPVRQIEIARWVTQFDSRRRQWRLEVDTSALPRSRSQVRQPDTGRVDIDVWQPGRHGRPGVGIGIESGEIPLGSRPVPQAAQRNGFVVVTEGGKARIDTGAIRPSHWVLAYPDGRYSPRRPWQTPGGGFWLQALPDGDAVEIRLAVTPDRLTAGRTAGANAASVRGWPGSWISVASFVHEADGSDTLVLGQAGSRYASTAMVRVRLERP